MISVIIPTFNRCDTLPRAIDSVFAQDCTEPLEVIVVDDGSQDGTLDLLQQSYPAVICLSQDNQGVSAARNHGLRRARGEWIALLDSDDEWLPHKLSLQLRGLQRTNMLVSHTEEIWIRSGVRVNQMKKHHKQGGWIFQACLPLCAMSPSSIVMHRSVVDAVGEFDEDLPACEDYDYWLRLTPNYAVDFVAQPSIIKYGGHADQLSRKHWGMDRFRVRALNKILKSKLSAADKQAAQTVLQQKLDILMQGARKHNNQALIDECLGHQAAIARN